MGFFSAVKKLFAGDAAPGEAQAADGREPSAAPEAASAEGDLQSAADDEALTLALRRAEPRLSAWLAVMLDGVTEADELLWRRLRF